MHKYLMTLAILSCLVFRAEASGAEPRWEYPVGVWNAEPGWEPGVVKLGADRERIQNMPILVRPYRPLHVYGNVVRRRYYHGRTLPTWQEISMSMGMLLGGR